MNEFWLQARLRIGKRNVIASGLIFASTYLIFLFSPLYQVSDSKYSMLLSQSLLEYRSFSLDHYAIPRLKPAVGDLTYKNGNMYQIELVGPHLYYFPAQGSSVLSVPYVAVANALGLSAVNEDGTYNALGEIKIQTGLAALLMAVAVTIFFLTSRLILPFGWSVVVAVGAALGTQIWSTASRGLWSHTWTTFLSALVVYLLLAADHSLPAAVRSFRGNRRGLACRIRALFTLSLRQAGAELLRRKPANVFCICAGPAG